MSIKDNIEHGKVLLNQGIDLLLLRLQLLNVNLAEQAGNAVKMAVWLVLSAVFLFVGLISLLFGLDRVLDPQAAVWTFFGIAGGSILLIVIVLAVILGSWKKRNNEITSTLRAIQTDIAYLRGQNPTEQEGGEHE